MNFVMNGLSGSAAQMLLNHNMDVGVLKPWIGEDGRSYVQLTDNNGKQIVRPVTNDATLRKDEWILLDQTVIKAAQERLKAVSDLRSSGLQFVIPNGMAKMNFEHQTQSDINDAVASMDGMAKSQNDRPLYGLSSLPLIILHKDFEFPARQIAISRNGSTPLDLSMAELAGRKVAELAEKMLIGTVSPYEYGGATAYGYTTYPDRLTYELADPTGNNWTPDQTVRDVLAMRQSSIDNLYYGPWKLYVGTKWTQYLDEDYSAAKGDATLRERIMKIDGIRAVTTLDFLPEYQMVLVQQTSDVVREVVGMEVQTVQWESHGGMMMHYKVMCIMVPQIRSDFYGKTGIVHGNLA